MTRRLALALLAAAPLALFAVMPVLGHPGHEHKVMGTVTMAAADHVMLKDKDGKAATIYINRDTKVVKDKRAMQVSDIKTGLRVVVTAVTEGEKGKEKMIAKTIQLGGGETSE